MALRRQSPKEKAAARMAGNNKWQDLAPKPVVTGVKWADREKIFTGTIERGFVNLHGGTDD